MIPYIVSAAIVVPSLILFYFWWKIFHMPGSVYTGPFLPLSPEEERKEAMLRRDMEEITVRIGERNIQRKYDEFIATADYIERELQAAGYQVRRIEFTARGLPVWNFETEIRGSSKAEEIVVIGAHYDTVSGSPGANDNGTAVAGLLSFARAFAGKATERTLRFVFFANEELPYYGTEECGSFRYARECRARDENIVGMLCLETYGFYTEEPGSQRYPKPLNYFFPSTGNFVAFVANQGSRDLVRGVVKSFRRGCRFPSEGVACPERIRDISRSDHACFWMQGYPALMITDTANFRYVHYHTPQDTYDKINFPAYARVQVGLENVVEELVGA